MAASNEATAATWLHDLKKAKKTAMVQDGFKKIHFTFADGREMVEEWSTQNDTLATRKWRKPTTLGGNSQWEYEVGESLAPQPLDELGLGLSSNNPVFIRKDTRKSFQWRIRNLPYPIDVYSLTVNDDNVAVLRTSNKKYYKKFDIPDLKRIGVPIVSDVFSMAHANNTLIISYDKPQQYLEFEQITKRQRDALKASGDGDVDCAQQ
eukprot:m.483370 g.483370  ORF g.483370 m.483370 type:complete len:207 (+) comp21726_c0_seq6:327-947(+)